MTSEECHAADEKIAPSQELPENRPTSEPRKTKPLGACPRINAYSPLISGQSYGLGVEMNTPG